MQLTLSWNHHCEILSVKVILKKLEFVQNNRHYNIYLIKEIIINLSKVNMHYKPFRYKSLSLMRSVIKRKIILYWHATTLLKIIYKHGDMKILKV